MRVETLLPLGKVDPGLRRAEIPLDLHRIGETAKLVEDLGYDGLVFEETKDDPFVLLALAASTTARVSLSSSVAIAFPRSPTVTAMSAWTLQKLSRGRFTLGLGPQVMAHIRRRYGVQPSKPGPWMRDYVRAVRAVWSCWQHRTKLDFASEHYRLDLMVPLFDPGPIEHPDIPIHLAAVNPVMCRIAGEVADGIRPHPVCTPSYIEDVMLPAARQGAGTDRKLAVCMKPLVASARTEAELQPRIRDARARIAFYASTPGYRRAFDHLGLGDLADAAKRLSRDQRWEDLPALISDEVLDAFAVIGTYDTVAQSLVDRFGRVVTSCEFSIQVRDEQDRATLAHMVRWIQSQSARTAEVSL